MLDIQYPKPRNRLFSPELINALSGRLGETSKDQFTKEKTPPKNERFWMRFVDGSSASYAYYHIGLVEVRGKSEIVLHCNCSNLTSIKIEGVNLDRLADSFIDQSLGEIKENDHPEFSPFGQITVEKIVLERRTTKS